jgi:DNA-binding transcriptional LysR family regulator
MDLCFDAALPSIAATPLPRGVSRFLEGHPDVRVRIMDATSSEVLGHVRAGRADLALTDATDATGSQADLAVVPLLADPVVAVLPPGHALAGKAEVTWRELAGERSLIEPAITRELAVVSRRHPPLAPPAAGFLGQLTASSAS